VRSDLGTVALTREVVALRCGLDTGQWDEQDTSLRCRNLLKTEPQRYTHGNIRTETPPFDNARAHGLYKALFGEVEDLIRDAAKLVIETWLVDEEPSPARSEDTGEAEPADASPEVIDPDRRHGECRVRGGHEGPGPHQDIAQRSAVSAPRDGQVSPAERLGWSA
jgi:hypothetical protein